MPPHVANATGVEEGSRLILQVRGGNIPVELLPPASAEIKERAQRIEENSETLLRGLDGLETKTKKICSVGALENSPTIYCWVQQ